MREISAVEVIDGIVTTWAIGLFLPILVRYAILRRPLAKWWAIAMTILLYVVNLVVFLALGSKSHSHLALVLISLVTLVILMRPKRAGPTSAVLPSTDTQEAGARAIQSVAGSSAAAPTEQSASKPSDTLARMTLVNDVTASAGMPAAPTRAVLGGWTRLGILLSCLWIVVVIVDAWHQWNTAGCADSGPCMVDWSNDALENNLDADIVRWSVVFASAMLPVLTMWLPMICMSSFRWVRAGFRSNEPTTANRKG